MRESDHRLPGPLLLALLVRCAGLAACAGPSVDGTPATTARVGLDARASAAMVDRLETETTRALAAIDARLAVRERLAPSQAELGQAVTAALVAGDESVVVVSGGADLFSFDARARQLDEAHARLSGVHEAADVGPSGSPVAQPGLELELLARLVEEERARVDEERDLPRSASELVRGVVSTWAPIESLTEAKQRDTWLTKRLEGIAASLVGATLRPIAILELEDALDPLEHLAEPAGFPRAQAAMARLRLALGKLPRGGAHREGWDSLRRALAVHLGVTLAPDALRTLERLEARLREESTERLSHVTEREGQAAREEAEALLLRSGSCGMAQGSRVRSLSPPPERAAICAALDQIVHPESLAGALALHDDVALALLATDIDGDDKDPDGAASAHALFAAVPPERKARLVRLVAARPLVPLGVALMLDLLDRGGRLPAARAARAAAWLSFGDAPLDVVARELSF